MKKTGIKYILESMHGAKLISDTGSKEITSVAIDSRQVKSGTLFFAVIGERNDGHDFLPAVKESGCLAAVVSNPDWAKKISETGDMTVILVNNTRDALMQLAKQYMADWKDLIKVAVTGSVGKTSTKDFLGAVLSAKYKTGKTPGNLNSDYGVPLTVFGFEDDIEAAVIEMGAGESVHISELADIARPQIGVVTNVGTSHLEVFGTREKLSIEKLGITRYFNDKETVIVNSDCDMLTRQKVSKIVPSGTAILTVGSEDDNNFIFRDIKDSGIDGVSCTLDVQTGDADYDGTFELTIPVVGSHNLGNATLAIAAGTRLGIKPKDAILALSNTHFSSGRLEIDRRDNITIINDAYNASPESMKAGIKMLMASKAERHVAILGDMYELGDGSVELHRSVGAYAVGAGLELLITIGSNAEAIASAAEDALMGAENNIACKMRVISYKDKNEAIKDLNTTLHKGDLILVKASRGMKLEEVISAIS
ncbi:UDP-N-acetylmuramoyl-tripeptide--D-alanyl-D-alanine ligase [Mogibacterium diversum]